MMITEIKTNKFLRKLDANLPRYVSLPVVYAILDHVDPILGVACATYEKYAKASATGLRTVARTIPALHQHGLLRKQSRYDGPPVLWVPELLDMKADEAVRRARRLAHHKDENPPAANPSLDTCEQLKLREQRCAKAKAPGHTDKQKILRLVYSYCDARGLTPQDPQTLTKAIHDAARIRPDGLKHLDGRALRKAYNRARALLPEAYDRWVGLIEKWDKSYNRQKARGLVDRLVTAVGNRPRGILGKLFDHLERQICDHLPKKVGRLESECEHLEKDAYYIPQLRDLKRDESSDQVYAALADGPKTMKQLAQIFGRSYDAIRSIGVRLRHAGRIKSIWRGDQFMWAQAGTAPLFVPARDAIVEALKEGPINVSRLAKKTGKGESTVKIALHRHLLRNGKVMRTKHGIYALAGTASPYISKCDAIIAALKKGPMTGTTLAQETGTTPSSLYQFIDLLLANRKVIRIKHGTYALAGTGQVFVPTSDAIIKVLSKQAMTLGPLVRRVNKSTNSSRSPGTVTTVLRRLKKEGTVKQDRRGGEYRLVPDLGQPQRRRETGRAAA
jgi:hypothetical protein